MKRKILYAVAALCVIVLIIFFATRKGEKQREGEPFTVKRANVVYSTEQTGIVKAQVGAIVKVGTRATGTLKRLKFQVGDFVKKGDLIVEIDDREILANIRNSEAAVEQQRRDLEAKRAQDAYNQMNYQREQRLLVKEYTTKDSVEKAKRELDVSRAQVELGKAKIREAQEKLNALKVSHSYTRIFAPISGYISSVATQEGETVVSGLSAPNLITIIDPTRLEMWIYVDETDIGRVKPGLKVEYWVDAYRDKAYKGVIDRIYPQPEIKENIVYYLAIVKIDPDDALTLKPEMTSHVRIIVEEKPNVIVVPNGAIRFEDRKNVVYLRSKGKTVRKEVTPGIRDQRYTEITSGLAEGEEVIVPSVAPAAKKPRNNVGH
ncbi:MAG: efflux RND transporter periplasmic adaptor subunit [Syntrophorhabdaceae bacterium]|nr:efflux RND transporter periplasmic adaptor subunit [Syntrophorhabdaceae bacterium]